jgi:hypothetical protein
MKVIYAQAAALAPETDCVKAHPYKPMMQPKLVELPKQPWAHESREQTPHKQSPSGQHYDCADGKSKGTPPNPKLSCESRLTLRQHKKR